MTLEIVSRFLLLYGAFATGAVLIFMYLIARFYQRSSGDKTHYRWFLLPIFCLVAAFIRNDFRTDPVGMYVARRVS